MKNNILRLSNLILRKWNSVKVLSNKIFNYLLLKIHTLKISLNFKKQEHIIICGPDIEGSSVLHNAIRNSVSSKTYSTNNNISALHTLNLFKTSIVTHEPSDLFSVTQIQDFLSDFRSVKFIIVVKDPRSLLTEVHNDIPWQYYQSWDFGFYTSPHPSFTRPGVGKAFDEMDKMKETANTQYQVIRYEDFLASPDDIQAQITGFTNFQFEKSFSDYLSNTNVSNENKSGSDHTSPALSSDSWKDLKHAYRLNTLYQLFPAIQDRVKEYGYPEDEKISINSNAGVSANKGTVVGMYTPDETYRNEAKRMMASLDLLGIKHSIDELPPVEEIAMIDNPEDYPAWFVQKLARYYKPTWLRQKREELRGPILYCDVDAFFHKDPWPYLSLYEGDAAVFSTEDGVIISSTIWLNDSLGAHKILELWENQCKAKRLEVFNSWPDVVPSTSDQPILKDIVSKNKQTKSFHIQQIPPTMLHIFDLHSYTPLEDVFIEQLQASRVAKTWRKKDPLTGISRRDKRISELEKLLAKK